MLLKNPPTIYGRFGTGATAINNYGQIVGGSGVVHLDNKGNASFSYHAAMWVSSAADNTVYSVFDLGTVDGVSYAVAINSVGSVVGEYGDEPATRAFIWTPSIPNGTSGNMIDLNQALSANDKANWVLREATGINDFGQIVGYAMYDTDGPGSKPAVPRAFLLTPVPEPTSFTLFALCVAAVVSCHRVHSLRREFNWCPRKKISPGRVARG